MKFSHSHGSLTAFAQESALGLNRMTPAAVRTPSMSERFLRGLTLAALLTGCTGELFTPAGPEGGVNVGPATGEEGSPSPTSFTCNADAEGVAVPLRRLSKLHFRNSVHDLMVATLPSEGELVWAEVAAAFDNVPGDATDEHKPFSGMDQNVSQQNVAAIPRQPEPSSVSRNAARTNN